MKAKAISLDSRNDGQADSAKVCSRHQHKHPLGHYRVMKANGVNASHAMKDPTAIKPAVQH